MNGVFPQPVRVLPESARVTPLPSPLRGEGWGEGGCPRFAGESDRLGSHADIVVQKLGGKVRSIRPDQGLEPTVTLLLRA